MSKCFLLITLLTFAAPAGPAFAEATDRQKVADALGLAPPGLVLYQELFRCRRLLIGRSVGPSSKGWEASMQSQGGHFVSLASLDGEAGLVQYSVDAGRFFALPSLGTIARPGAYQLSAPNGEALYVRYLGPRGGIDTWSQKTENRGDGSPKQKLEPVSLSQDFLNAFVKSDVLSIIPGIRASYRYAVEAIDSSREKGEILAERRRAALIDHQAAALGCHEVSDPDVRKAAIDSGFVPFSRSEVDAAVERLRKRLNGSAI